jgi:hypothetical protein
MKPKFILMLTYNDRTVENALEIFKEHWDTPVTHWGFKDVGLPKNEMKKVVEAMKKVDKTTFLEVVSLSEADGLAGAKLAVDLGFDILMGTVFFESINEYIKDKRIKYFPFAGHVHSHPSILDGSIEEIVDHARKLESNGVSGMDLLTYRFTGDAPKLLEQVVNVTKVPIVSAGSIDSYNKIAEVWTAGAWGFTIGTALFEKRFDPNGTFRENILAVCDWLNKTSKADLGKYLE